MSCYVNPYNSFGNEREMPSIPYGSSSYYQERPTTTGMTPAMTLPTGIPSGPPFGSVPPASTTPVIPSGIQVPQTVINPYFLAGKLRSYIGKDVRVEFLIGTNGPLVDRIGTLLEVGASFITIRPTMSDDTLVCDLFSIKFVTVYG